jgi:hypothetical protein
VGKQAPTPGDFTGAANQQAQASQGNVQAQTQANRPNISGVGTSQQWTQGPDGQWQLAQGYGQNQGLATQLQGQAQDALSTPLDNGTAARDQAISSAYGASTSRLDPQWAQQEQLTDSGLANAGLDPGSAAYRAAKLAQSQSKNDAYNQAMASAVHEGNTAQAQTFAENMAARNTPLQQLLQLGQLAGQNPTYNTAGIGETPQLLAALMGQNSANLGAWNATNQANADAVNGATQLIGSVGGLATKAFGF